MSRWWVALLLVGCRRESPGKVEAVKPLPSAELPPPPKPPEPFRITEETSDVVSLQLEGQSVVVWTALGDLHRYAIAPNAARIELPKPGVAGGGWFRRGLNVMVEGERIFSVAWDITARDKPQLVVQEPTGTKVLGSFLPAVTGLVVDATNLYAMQANMATLDSAILSVPRAGGPMKTVFKTRDAMYMLGQTSTHLYWHHRTAKQSLIRRLAKSGGAPEDVVGTAPEGTLAVFENAVLFGDRAGVHRVQGGALEKIGGSAGAVRFTWDGAAPAWISVGAVRTPRGQLAEVEGEARAFVANRDWVVWATAKRVFAIAATPSAP